MRFIHTMSRVSRPGAALISLTVIGGAALLAGCGGGSSTSTNTARIRAFDANPNGGTATVSVNGNAISGSQTFAAASTYQYLGNGASTATFSLSANPATTYPPVAENFSVGSFYTLIAAGRADIPSAADPRYPSLIVASDNLNTPASNQASLRIIQAAPDAGSVDVLVNGAIVATGAAYKSVSNYVNVSGGSATIQVNLTGTNTILAGPQAVSITTGQVYTIIVEEPTVTPAPAYGIQSLDDTTSQ